MATDPATQKPWYRHPYLWLVLVLPVIAVVASLSFVRLAFSHQDDMVRDDWYMDGKTLRQDLSRDTLAKQLGLSAQVQVSPSGQVDVHFVSEKPVVWPAQLWLGFFHPVKQARDIQITLRLQADGHYQAQAPALLQARGRYHAELENGGDWRLQQEVLLPLQQLTLRPLERIQ